MVGRSPCSRGVLIGRLVVRAQAARRPQHEPVSVLIADFQNRTSDPTFDRTLEPMLKRALEGAGFITAYDRTAAVSTLGVRPPRDWTKWPRVSLR